MSTPRTRTTSPTGGRLPTPASVVKRNGHRAIASPRARVIGGAGGGPHAPVLGSIDRESSSSESLQNHSSSSSSSYSSSAAAAQRRKLTTFMFSALVLFSSLTVVLLLLDFKSFHNASHLQSVDFEITDESPTHRTAMVITEERNAPAPAKKMLFAMVISSATEAAVQWREFMRSRSWLAHYLRSCANGVDDALCKRMDYRFVLGTKGLNESVLRALESEAEEKGDLLLLDNFQDTYLNLNYKVAEGITEVVRRGNAYQYDAVMKIDDDVWLDLDAFLNFVQSHIPQNGTGFVMSRIQWHSKVRKDTSRFWYDLEFPMAYYPPYPNGPVYVMSWNAAEFIADNYSKKLLKVFKFEDAMIGTWLLPLDLVWVHDDRFATGYPTTHCSWETPFFAYHIFGQVRTKQQIMQMQEMFTTNKLTCGDPCSCPETEHHDIAAYKTWEYKLAKPKGTPQPTIEP
eukprot:TRINITY_DN3663_c0_g1_i1.p1 TRINITY_DN3663_c0_g1~~TRINITY_DN3663_c0_g1_i1.p1  ORF type:complete len:457 (+),score=95.95 TRINITY_DN3663_c0_g1_i1:32-1402(+)